jgi:hypothetical protein
MCLGQVYSKYGPKPLGQIAQSIVFYMFNELCCFYHRRELVSQSLTIAIRGAPALPQTQ